MNTERLRELCDATEAGSARIEDIAELVVLARKAAHTLIALRAIVKTMEFIETRAKARPVNFKAAFLSSVKGLRDRLGA